MATHRESTRRLHDAPTIAVQRRHERLLRAAETVAQLIARDGIPPSVRAVARELDIDVRLAYQRLADAAAEGWLIHHGQETPCPYSVLGPVPDGRGSGARGVCCLTAGHEGDCRVTGVFEPSARLLRHLGAAS